MKKLGIEKTNTEHTKSSKDVSPDVPEVQDEHLSDPEIELRTEIECYDCVRYREEGCPGDWIPEQCVYASFENYDIFDGRDI